MGFPLTDLLSKPSATLQMIESLCEKLEALLPHSFIAKQQSHFQAKLKSDLQLGEFLVIGDFSENYLFILQDASQGYHW